MYEIIDNKGTIFSGNEEEITAIFYAIVNGDKELDWVGDLKLIEVKSILK